jgi:hypothetical protein
MFLAILPAVSTPLKRGLMVANGVGVVDSDYCGPEDEVKVAVLNFSEESFESVPAIASRKASCFLRPRWSGRRLPNWRANREEGLRDGPGRRQQMRSVRSASVSNE